MIQGTDSGTCDYRYHPMYYSKTPNDPNAWLSEPKPDRLKYMDASSKMWSRSTDVGEFGSCANGDKETENDVDAHCLNYCGSFVSEL